MASFSRIVVVICAIIITILGFAGFLASLIGFTSSGLDILQAGNIKSTIMSFKYVILGFGLVLFFVGIAGTYGACKTNRFFLTIYGIVTLLSSIAFLLAGIIGLASVYNNGVLADIESPLDKVKTSNVYYYQNQLVSQTYSQLCSTACPCYLDDAALQAIQSASKTSQSTDPFPINFTTLNYQLTVGPAVKVQDCKSESAINTTLADSMALLESTLHCTGIFDATPYYLFTNINNDSDMIGKFPSCASAIQVLIKSYGKKIGIVCFVAFAILLLNTILSCYICCHPEHKKEFGFGKSDDYRKV